MILVSHIDLTGAIQQDSLVQWYSYSQENIELSKKENKPVFIMIKADWCHACRMYEEITLNTAEIASFLNGNFIPILVDFDREGEIASKYSVLGPPTTIILLANGEKVISIPGFIAKDKLLESLENSLNPLKRGSIEGARMSFQVNSFERLSFENTIPRFAVPVPSEKSGVERLPEPILGIRLIFILFFAIISGYWYFKNN
jgi:thiol-disulfide isomerase/thioredoxin